MIDDDVSEVLLTSAHSRERSVDVQVLGDLLPKSLERPTNTQSIKALMRSQLQQSDVTSIIDQK